MDKIEWGQQGQALLEHYCLSRTAERSTPCPCACRRHQLLEKGSIMVVTKEMSGPSAKHDGRWDTPRNYPPCKKEEAWDACG